MINQTIDREVPSKPAVSKAMSQLLPDTPNLAITTKSAMIADTSPA